MFISHGRTRDTSLSAFFFFFFFFLNYEWHVLRKLFVTGRFVISEIQSGDLELGLIAAERAICSVLRKADR
jgi:hypothetical protein